MSVRDEDVAARRDEHIARLVECIRAVSRHPRFAQRQQHLSVLAKLEDLVPFPGLAIAIRYPNIVIFIYEKAMRTDNHPRAKALHQIARRIEFENWRKVRSGAR